MSIQVLPLDLLATLIITFNNLKQASFIMRLKVLIENNLLTAYVLALHFLVAAREFMWLHLSALQSDRAAFFEEAFSLIWTIYDL